MSLYKQFLSRAAVAGLLGLALAAAPAAAQQAAPAAAGGTIKIAVIDTEKILLSSVAGKKALADLTTLQEATENELRSGGEELYVLQTNISVGLICVAQD